MSHELGTPGAAPAAQAAAAAADQPQSKALLRQLRQREAQGAAGGDGLTRSPEAASLVCVETRTVGEDVYWRGVRGRGGESPAC